MRKPDYERDGVRLYLADCLEVLPELSGVDCVVTSPPYNQMSAIPDTPSGAWADSHGGAGFVRRWNECGYEDEMNEGEYQIWQNAVFAAVSRISSDDASLFYNHQVCWRDGEILHPVIWFRPEGWLFREEVIWDRGGGMMSNAKMFCRFDERILWFDKGHHKWNQSSTGHGTIWRIARMQQQQGKLHPVQFPNEIPYRCIQATTNIGDTVLDPFMGSGTTGVACIQTGRNFIGIEKDPTYFAISVKRIDAALDADRDSLWTAKQLAEQQRELFSEDAAS